MAIVPSVTHNSSATQFEILSNAGKSLLSYRRSGDTITLVHTEVPASLEGQGYGSALAEAALQYAKAEGIRVIPSCPFVASYVQQHPEHASLLAPR